MGMAFFNELIGNPLGLIFTTIVGILLMYLAAIPAAVMVIVGAGLAGVNIYVGSQMLISALEVKKNARNMHEYKKAAKLFAESITKIGINVLWLIISLVQTGKAIYEGKEIRITQKTKKYTTYEKSCLKELEKIENFTDSAIEHIFEGNINKRGKAGGYHYECDDKIIIKCESGDGEKAIKPWSVSTIIYDNGLYVHELYKTCFQEISADKYFSVLQGKDWTGGPVFDDYC